MGMKKKTVKKKTKKKGKHPGGRPSKITTVNLSEVEHLTKNGYTDKQLAKVYSVTEQTINNWKKAYPEFFESLKCGKMLANAKVVASLWQRACGYSHPEVHISNYKGKITKTNIIKHYPPDPTSMIYWTKNRMPEDWREKTEHLQIIEERMDLEELTNDQIDELIAKHDHLHKT